MHPDDESVSIGVKIVDRKIVVRFITHCRKLRNNLPFRVYTCLVAHKCQHRLVSDHDLLSFASVLGLSSASSLPTCAISTPLVGVWIQPGLVDVITINKTWCSLKGACVATGGQHEAKNKFIFYNE